MVQITLDGGADKFGLDLGDTEEDTQPKVHSTSKILRSTRERKGDLFGRKEDHLGLIFNRQTANDISQGCLNMN